MSAYKKIQCSIVDKDALLEALSQLGFSPKVHEKPQSLSGFRGDRRDEKAEIIVSRHELNNLFSGASNDLGFLYDASKEEFTMICSDYDINCEIDQRVKQAYAKVVIEKALKKQGFKVNVNVMDGSLSKPKRRQRSKINIQGRKLI